MQGYVDLIQKPAWDESRKSLSGKSALIGAEPYKMTLALNGYVPVKVEAPGVNSSIVIRKDDPNLADLWLETDKNGEWDWKISFAGRIGKNPR